MPLYIGFAANNYCVRNNKVDEHDISDPSTLFDTLKHYLATLTVQDDPQLHHTENKVH